VGTANTGGGGGGGATIYQDGSTYRYGANGGSGVLVVRYTRSQVGG
jgi:hypothetical protein